MEERIQKIKESLFAQKRTVALERAFLIKESYENTQDESVIIQRAKAYKHILENHVIDIDDYDLLAGVRTVTPRAGVISPEMSPYWILDELDDFGTREQDRFEINDCDKKAYREILYPFFQERSLNDHYCQLVSDDVKKASQSGVFAINQTDKGQGHIIPDYTIILNHGLKALIDQLKEYTDKQPNNEFYQAALICAQATSNYILRYYEMVVIRIQQCHNKKRKQELEALAEVLKKIATDKPETFYEAVQLFWLICVCLQHESNASSISVGRFDQYMYSYYLQEEDKSFAKTLMQCLYLKFNSIVAIRSRESAKYFAGFPIGYTIALGGKNEQGIDQTNELSELMLELQEIIRLPQPNLSVRINKDSSDHWLSLTAKTIRIGTGLPQLFNDEVIIDGFIERGIEEKDAYDYAIVGCVEISIPGKMYGLHDIAMFNLLKCLEVTLDEHPEGFMSYQDLVHAIEENISLYIRYMVEGSNACDQAHQMYAPTPFLSCLIHDCLKKGKDVSAGGAKYNFSGVQGIGCPNLNDSLYVLKQVIFEKKEKTYQEFMDILHNNWQGHEQFRQHCINDFYKYGNDHDEVDCLGANLLSYYNNEVIKYKNIRGGIFQPGSYTVSAHIPLGAKVHASADGRKDKEQLADGGLSPMVGRDILGPTASLKSVSKLNNIETTNGSLLNVKFSPATLKGETGIHNMVAYIRVFSKLKIQHIQFNVVDTKTLQDAQIHPENYKNLVVRVAGYSAMYTELSKEIQQDIINRSVKEF